jgi:hypothetical protein
MRVDPRRVRGERAGAWTIEVDVTNLRLPGMTEAPDIKARGFGQAVTTHVKRLKKPVRKNTQINYYF